MLFEDIQQKIQNAKSLDFGQILNASIELFKKVWLQGLIMQLIMIGFMIPFALILYVPLIMFGLLDATNPDALESLAPLALFFVMIAYVLFVFAMIVLSFGLKAGLYRIMKQKEANVTGSDDYFFFFRRPYLRKTINLSMSYFGISLVATLLCVLPIIYVIVPLSLLPVFYAMNPELSSSDLIKGSFGLGNKKWFITFGLTLVAGMLAQVVGMLMCGIGIFFTALFAIIPVYFIYKDSIGLADDDSDLKLIGENEMF